MTIIVNHLHLFYDITEKLPLKHVHEKELLVFLVILIEL